MKIKKLIYFTLFINTFFLSNNIFCPIFSEPGWLKQINAYNLNKIAASKDIKQEHFKRASTYLNAAIRRLKIISNAKKEIEISTPTRLFFSSKGFFKKTLINNPVLASTSFNEFLKFEVKTINDLQKEITKIITKKIEKKAKAKKKKEKEIKGKKKVEPTKKTRAGDIAQKAFKLTNNYRKSKGKKGLNWESTLAKVAMQHSQYMAKKSQKLNRIQINHDNLKVRANKFKPGSAGVAENVAFSTEDPRNPRDIGEITFKGWKESPGHNKNMLGDFTHSAIAAFAVKSPDPSFPANIWYLTQIFAKY